MPPPVSVPEIALQEERRRGGKTGSLRPVHLYLRRLAGAMRGEWLKELDHSTPFLFAPVAFGLGSCLYFLAPFEPQATLLSLLAALPALGLLLLRNPAGRRFLLALLLAASGMLLAKAHIVRLDTPMLGQTVDTTLTGQILRIERTRTSKWRLLIDARSTASPRLQHPPVKVQLVIPHLPRQWQPGDFLKGRARLFPLQGPVRPGSYDFAFHAFHAGIGATGFFHGMPRRLHPPSPDLQALDMQQGLVRSIRLGIERIRHALAQRIRSRIGGDEGEVATALITGMQSGIGEEVNETLRRTGLAHMLSISGLHMALVTGLVIGAIRFGLALAPVLACTHPIRKWAAAASLLALVFYLLLSGAAVATMRSAIMLAVMLLAVIADRPAITLRNLAISACIILFLYPHEVLNPGFQMSFAATAALIASYRAWFQWQRRDEEGMHVRLHAWPVRMLRRLIFAIGALAAASLIAGLATGIFGIWHFHRTAPLGVLANLAAMPIVSFAVMPLAVLSVLLIPAGLDAMAFQLLGVAISKVLQIADWLSGLTPFDVVGMVPPASFVLAAFGLILLTLPVSRFRLLCLPCFLPALLLIPSRSVPVIFISEDGRLVGVRTGDFLAINRNSARNFTLNNWRNAIAAGAILPSRQGQAAEQGFSCSEGLCTIRVAPGLGIARAEDELAARKGCTAQLLILADPAIPEDICIALPPPPGDPPQTPPVVISAAQLARTGSVQIHLRKKEGEAGFELLQEHAISEPWRPWHLHRSRQASTMAGSQQGPPFSFSSAGSIQRGGPES